MGALLALMAREPYRLACGLRVTSESQILHVRFHQVLNRAPVETSQLNMSRILLQQWIVTNLVEEEPIVVGIDDTIERRWSPIRLNDRLQGSIRDPVRSSRGHFVKTSGLRWLCFTLLNSIAVEIQAIKALPFQTLLGKIEERYAYVNVD